MRCQKIQKDSKQFQQIPKDSKEPKSKEYFGVEEPTRAQKANGSSSPSVWRIKDLDAPALLGCLKIV